jgi:hypothetical protein
MVNEAPKTIASFACNRLRARLLSVGLCDSVTPKIRNPSDLVGSALHEIYRLQVSHSTWLWISFASCRKLMASASSPNRYVKNNLFGPPSSRSNPGPYENHGTYVCFWTRSMYLTTTSCICEAIIAVIQVKHTHAFCITDEQSTYDKQETGNALYCGCKRCIRGSLLHCGYTARPERHTYQSVTTLHLLFVSGPERCTPQHNWTILHSCWTCNQ